MQNYLSEKMLLKEVHSKKILTRGFFLSYEGGIFVPKL
jgi:hypothetical protein